MDNNKKKNQTDELEEELKEVSPEETSEENPEPVQEEDSQLEQLKSEVADLKDRELRHLAEFDNYRKRTQKEKMEFYKNATADCVLQFLTVLDNLERAVESEEQESKMRTGVEMIVNQFKEILGKLDVHEIDALNQPFNPEYHNAVNQVEDDAYEENTVCQVFQKGYMMGNKVIRHAMVVVANP